MKRALLLLLSVFFMFSTTSCNPKEAESETKEYPVTIQQIKLETQPQHIVSLSPAITSVLQKLCPDSQRLSGVSDGCTAQEDIPRMGTVLHPDAEAIQKAGADLVFASAPLPEKESALLEESGIPVLILPSPQDGDGLTQYYKTIATAVFGRLTGEALAAETTDRLIEEIKAPFAGSSRLTGCYIGQQVIATPDTFVSYFMGLCGIDNIVSPDALHWEYSTIKAAAQNPQVILCGVGQKAAIAADSQLAGTLAVTEGRILEVDITLLEQFGDTLLTFSRQLAQGLGLAEPPAPAE